MSFSVSFAIGGHDRATAPCRARTCSLAPLFAAFCCPCRVGRRVTKLVIVDDHEALREGLAALLRAGGVEVVGTAGNAAAGVDLVEVFDPEVAILDIRLPDESGIELTRSLLTRHP